MPSHGLGPSAPDLGSIWQKVVSDSARSLSSLGEVEAIWNHQLSRQRSSPDTKAQHCRLIPDSAVECMISGACGGGWGLILHFFTEEET